MSENCNHDCSNCNENCNSRQIEPKVPLEDTKINKIVGVLSGKGGVGKSMVSSLLAVELAKKGYKVGIMDADITGPSIPKMFDMHEPAYGDEKGVFPNLSNKYGIKILSINMMLESEDTPVLWRGPIIGGMVTQFYTEAHWGELDYLVIDMPPGTSDVALSVLQEIPVDGLVMVSNPSKLVSMIVSKAIVMAQKTDTKMIGLVENMAYVKCPDCGKIIKIHGDNDTENICQKYNLDVLASLPLDTELANLSDEGKIEDYSSNYIDELVASVITF